MCSCYVSSAGAGASPTNSTSYTSYARFFSFAPNAKISCKVGLFLRHYLKCQLHHPFRDPFPLSAHFQVLSSHHLAHYLSHTLRPAFSTGAAPGKPGVFPILITMLSVGTLQGSSRENTRVHDESIQRLARMKGEQGLERQDLFIAGVLWARQTPHALDYLAAFISVSLL